MREDDQIANDPTPLPFIDRRVDVGQGTQNRTDPRSPVRFALLTFNQGSGICFALVCLSYVTIGTGFSSCVGGRSRMFRNECLPEPTTNTGPP